MSGLKVLYVDDDADIRDVAALALEMDPAVEVRTAASGAETLSQLDAGAWRPDAIMLDMMMPGLDGLGLMAQIRQRPGLAAIPVIFITGRTEAREQRRLTDAGAAGVIAKPFDPLALARQVRAILAKA